MPLIKKDIANVDIGITEQQIRYLETINADPPIDPFDLRRNLGCRAIREMEAMIANWWQTNLFLAYLGQMLEKIGTPVTHDIITAPETKAAVLLEMGYTCREVNDKLELPAGTVLKWGQNLKKSKSPFLKIVELKVTDMAKNIETTEKEKPVLTAADIKNKVDTQLKNQVAFSIGTGRAIGDVINDYIHLLYFKYQFDNNITEGDIVTLLREAFRTCNPNDKKFNVKKYSEAYRAGRLSMVRDMGDGLLETFRTYINTMNDNLSSGLLNIDQKITIKEYAALIKDLATAASLYQSIAEAHQPDTEATFDVIPALDSQLSIPETDETEKTLPAPLDTPKALVADTLKNTETDDYGKQEK